MGVLPEVFSMICRLPSGERFSITKEWLSSRGFDVDDDSVEVLDGKFFHVHKFCGCKLLDYSDGSDEYEKI